MAAPKLVQRRVAGADRYTWLVADPTRKRGRRVERAVRGAVIEITPEEAERGEALGVLVDPDVVVEEPPAAFTAATDEELEAMELAEVVAYLGQVPQELHDAEIDRLVELEELRADPRPEVLQLRPEA